jgi:L-serine kinase (ADP)
MKDSISEMLNFEKTVSTKHHFIEINEVFPHEKVMENRLDGLLTYINSLAPHIVIPSIVVTSENVIIDGHHRFHALKKLGFSKIPVHSINYLNDKIITHDDKKKMVSKDNIIKNALEKNLMEPKSTMHHVRINNNLYPIILLSKLVYMEK